jgi:hypothetical protein
MTIVLNSLARPLVRKRPFKLLFSFFSFFFLFFLFFSCFARSGLCCDGARQCDRRPEAGSFLKKRVEA